MSATRAKICGKCKLVVKDKAFLYCTGCNFNFHIECKGYEKRYYLLDADRKAKWKCDTCIRANRATNINTPMVPALPIPNSTSKPAEVKGIEPADLKVTENRKKHYNIAGISVLNTSLTGGEDDEGIDPFQNITIREKSQKDSSVCSDECSIQGESALEITTALKEYIANQMTTFTHQLLAKIDTRAFSINQFNTRCDKIEQRLATIEDSMHEKDSKGFIDLIETVDRLKNELNEKDQELLINEVEISGIPEVNGENPVHIATLVANKLGVKLAESDVVSAVRVGGRRESAAVPASARPTAGPTRSPPAPASAPAPTGEDPGPRLLVVRVLRRIQRDELLRAARVRRGADTAGLGLPGPARRFYVNERLTRANRLLFRRAREETRRLEWKFAWTKDGTILVRRDRGEPARRLRTEHDLAKVFGVQPVGDQ